MSDSAPLVLLFAVILAIVVVWLFAVFRQSPNKRVDAGAAVVASARSEGWPEVSISTFSSRPASTTAGNITEYEQHDNFETDYLLGTPGEIHVETEAFIHYRDGRGLETQRQITTRTLCPYDNDYAILAFCKLRQQNRSFLVSRIQEFVDSSTGEIIKDIVGHLRAVYANSPKGKTDAALDRLASDIAVLNYVGRASGTLSARKKAVITHFLLEREPVLDEHYLFDRLHDLAPSQSEFRKALKLVADFPDDRKRGLLTSIDKMKPLKGKADDFTQAALDIIQKRIQIAS